MIFGSIQRSITRLLRWMYLTTFCRSANTAIARMRRPGALFVPKLRDQAQNQLYRRKEPFKRKDKRGINRAVTPRLMVELVWTRTTQLCNRETAKNLGHLLAQNPCPPSEQFHHQTTVLVLPCWRYSWNLIARLASVAYVVQINRTTRRGYAYY